MASIDADRAFRSLARTLAAEKREPIPGTSDELVPAVDDGFASLDPDPDLFPEFLYPKKRKRDDEDDDSNEMFLRDYSRSRAPDFTRAGPGLQMDWESHLRFHLPLTDLGSGQVSLAHLRGVGSPTFTRATVATCRLADGTLKKVASGVPRSHYLSDGTYGGYLAEGARTNLCLRSEELDVNGSGTPWTHTRATVSADAIAAPDGTTTAESLVEDSTVTSTHFARQDFTKAASAIAYTASVFAKVGSGTRNIRLIVTDSTGSNGAAVIYNPSTGAVVTAAAAFGTGFSGVSASAEEWGDGWWRFTLSATSNTDTSLLLIFQLASGTNSSYSGDGASSVNLWGAQLEAAAFASSYIPTTTASVTRNADVLTYPSSGNLGATAGALYAEFVPGSVAAGTFPRIVEANDATGNERLMLQINDAFAGRFLVTDGGVAQATISSGTAVTGVLSKIAASYAANVFAVSTDGGAIGSDSSGTIPTVTTIQIGDGAGGTILFGTIKNVRLYDAQLPDSQLQKLTA